MENQAVIEASVKLYSVLVGFLLVLIFVLPCVLFALVSKFFQKTTRPTRHSLRSLVGHLRTVDSADTRMDFPDSDSSSFGIFGQIEFPVENVECVERMVCVKSPLGCIDTWKAYAPTMLYVADSDDKRLVTVKKLAPYDDANKNSHLSCLRAELSSLSHIPQHPHLLSLLGVCMSGASPTAIILEYPPYGSLHSFLVCKRRGRISNNANTWRSLSPSDEEPNVLVGVPGSVSQLCHQLSDKDVRMRPFKLPLNERFTELDELVWGLQIASAMDFLTSKEILHKRLSSENIVISAGFYLKLTGVEFDTPALHRSSTMLHLKRTPSGRNVRKWDAPEVYNSSIHTVETEVWRFGMVLWEVSSLGDTPFADTHNRMLAELLKKGETPHRPEECSQRLYNIMCSCWSVKSEDRPSFSTLVQKMQDMLTIFESQPLSVCNGSPNLSSHYKPTTTNPRMSRLRRPYSTTSSTSSVVLLMDPTPTPEPEHVLGYKETDV